jgi:aminopeptidase N
VGNRTPVTVGFDRRAYDEGARIIQAVALEMGGRARGVEFLRQLHRRRRFDPFTTVDLANEILAFSGADFHERFGRWLYNDTAAAATTGPYDWLHEVDLTPPEAVRRRYGH